MDTMTCRKCGHTKPIEQFPTSTTRKSGHTQPCKLCDNARRKQTYQAQRARDPEGLRQKMRDNLRQWRQAHPKKVYDQVMRYRARHREQFLQYQVQYHKEHIVDIHARHAAYHQRHRESRLLRSHLYAKSHRQQRADNENRRRARRRHAAVYEMIHRALVFARDQWICQLCHTRVKPQDASLDHIIPLSKGGEESYRNVCLVHTWCNSKKGNRAVAQQMRLF